MDILPKISVIMSVYNESVEELTKSIGSIINQTYSNIEFIIINDNPNNNNIKVAVKKANDSRILYYENETNLGLIKSLNRAITFATGDYIARMDADDISKPNRLKDELMYMIDNKIDLLGSFIEVIDENDIVQKKIMKFPKKKHQIEFFMRWGNCLAHPTWLVKKEVYKNLKGYRNVPNCEDYDFLLRAISYGYTIGNIPKVELSYRVRKNGISKSHEAEQYILRNHLSKTINNFNIPSDVSIKEYVDSKEFDIECKKFIYYKNLKLNLKKSNKKNKIKILIKLPQNLFFWKDTIEKFTLLLREHI